MSAGPEPRNRNTRFNGATHPLLKTPHYRSGRQAGLGVAAGLRCRGAGVAATYPDARPATAPNRTALHFALSWYRQIQTALDPAGASSEDLHPSRLARVA